jgi:hypothetical protein
LFIIFKEKQEEPFDSKCNVMRVEVVVVGVGEDGGKAQNASIVLPKLWRRCL